MKKSIDYILFDLFVKHIVFSDKSIFNILSIKNIEKNTELPIQLQYFIKLYRDLDLKNIDSSIFFNIYMNFKNLFMIQYYNEINKKWEILDNEVLKKLNENKFCRLIPYYNDELFLKKHEIIDENIRILNQYFILTP